MGSLKQSPNAFGVASGACCTVRPSNSSDGSGSACNQQASLACGSSGPCCIMTRCAELNQHHCNLDGITCLSPMQSGLNISSSTHTRQPKNATELKKATAPPFEPY